MSTSDVWSIQLEKSRSELGRPSSDADRASLLLDWLNQYSGQLFDEQVEELYELTNGLKLYDMMRKVSSTVFSEFENLNDDPSIWVLKKSNLTTLIHSMNEFGISSLRGDSTFDLSELVDVTKISKWSEDDEDSAEGQSSLLLLMEYVLTMCVLSGNTEILDGLRRLPKSDQHSLSATVKRVMTRHRFNKLRSYLSVHSLAVAASSSTRLDADSAVHNESFNFSDTPRVSETPRASMVSFRRSSCAIFEDLPTARDEDSVSPASQMWKPTAPTQDPEALRVEMSALKNNVRDLNQDLEVKIQELAIYQAEVEALRSQNEEYKEELIQSNTRGFSDKERHLMQALSEAEEKVRTLEDDVDESKGANATMKDKLNNAIVEQERLQKRLSQIETLSSRTDEVRQSLVTQNRDLENKLKSTLYSETELKATIRQLQDEKEALELGQTSRMLDEDDFMDTGDLEATVQEKKMLLSEVKRLKSELNVANLENTLLRTRVDGDNDESEFESTTRFHHARMDTLVACPSGSGGPLSPPPKECASHQFEMTIRRDADAFGSVTRRLEDSSDPMFASLQPQSEARNDSAPPTIQSLHEVVHKGLNDKCLATVFLFTDGGHSVSCDDAELKPKIEDAVQGWRGKLDDPPVFADPNAMSGKPRQGKADARGGCAEGCNIM